MSFPIAAVLVFVWFLLTPAIRLLLWLLAKRLGWLSRLFIAHAAALVIIIAATGFAQLGGPAFGGMAVMFAIAQGIAFLLDLLRPQAPPGV